jgi:hypothetical protein
MFLTVQVEETAGTSRDVLASRIDVRLYQLEFEQHCGVLHLLETEPVKPRGNTILGLLATVMQKRGWRRKQPWLRARTNGEQDTLAPLPQAPKIDFYRLYNLLAIDAHVLEQFVRLSEPAFDVSLCIQDYCELYQCSVDKTFPSQRYTIANHAALVNRKPGQARRIMLAQRVTTTDDCEPIVFDNDEINRINEAADGEVESMECEESMPTKKRQSLANKTPDNTVFTRLIPVSILPLFLTQLPLCYTRVNAILHECERLEKRVWSQFPDIVYYPSYLVEQVEAIEQNRRYASFSHQCAYATLQRPVDNEERRLHENEILQLRLDHAATLEVAMREMTRLRALLAQRGDVL